MPLQQVPKLSAMKLSCLVLMVGSLAACAETEEQINKRFAVQPGGKLVVDVDFGSIDVNTNATSEVIVDVLVENVADERTRECGSGKIKIR